MHLIAYVSESTLPPEQVGAAMAEIVRVAKVENQRRAITGVLFYVNGRFLQVIEGEEAQLRSLMKSIEADPRHTKIDYLIDTRTEVRGFSQWNMEAFPLDDRTLFDARILKELTDSFAANLLPRSDMLVFYYKTLMRQKTSA